VSDPLTIRECIERWADLGLPPASNPLVAVFGVDLRCPRAFDGFGRCQLERGHESGCFITDPGFTADPRWYTFRQGVVG